MPLVLKDRVKETSTTTGTGTLTLGGAATGFQSFAVIGNGNTTYYAIFDRTSQDWEVGVGTYTASGTTLSRDTVLESSNSGSLVNFGAGTKDVFCTYPAEKAVTLDDVQTLTNKTLTNPTINGFTGGTGVINIGSGQLYKDASGNVGIGTSSPGQKLSVVGTIESTTGGFRFPDGTTQATATGFRYVQTVYFTSSGTFSKADYPWLRAIRVKAQGGGGGGGRANATGASSVSAGDGGGGGAYAESFITDIAGLSSSVSVTCGSGGAGGDAGGAATDGGQSSFGSLVLAGGGGGGGTIGASGDPGFNTSTGLGSTSATGDLINEGGDGTVAVRISSSRSAGGNGGSSHLGGTRFARGSGTGSNVGLNGRLYGGGGSGGANANNQTLTNGGNGAQGIVIVDCYA
jgi:hypothetical protein